MDDLIRRSEAIRIASGYCHWTNIPAELAKLPSVTPAQNVCEDAISRQAVIDAIEKNAYRHTYLDQIIDIVSELPSVNPIPCEDAISRQAVLDCLTATKLKKFDFILQAREEIKKLPSVSTEKTGRWIPVSERLPEDGTYLICTDDGYIATIMYDRSMGWLLNSNIIAWMPLPQPYTAESEEA